MFKPIIIVNKSLPVVCNCNLFLAHSTPVYMQSCMMLTGKKSMQLSGTRVASFPGSPLRKQKLTVSDEKLGNSLGMRLVLEVTCHFIIVAILC